MIEVLNIESVNKGCLMATFDVRMHSLPFALPEFKLFQKGDNRWISLPSREFTNAAGEKKYKDWMTFDSESDKTKFKNQVMEILTAHMDKNALATPEPICDVNLSGFPTEDSPF